MKHESGPLAGKKVAVTRPIHQSEEIIDLIESRGGEAILAPTIEIVPSNSPEINKFIDDVMENKFSYLVFLSVNSIKCLLDQVKNREICDVFIQSLDKAKILCIGEKTRKALQETGVVSSVTDNQTTEGVIQSLGEDLKGDHIGIPRSSLADNSLRKVLEAKGAKVTEITAYNTRVPNDLEPVVKLIKEISIGSVYAVTFTSSSTAENMLAIAQKEGLGGEIEIWLRKTLVVAIGPKTRQTIEDLGIHVDVVPSTFSIESMIDELVEYTEASNE